MKTDSIIFATRPKSVGVFGFDGVRGSDIVGPLEAFLAAGNYAENQSGPYYKTSVIGVTGKSFVSDTGIRWKAIYLLSNAPSFDTIVLPGGNGMWKGDVCRRLSGWVANNVSKIRRIVMIGNGVYPVAQTGLLNGRKITTHWRFTQDVATKFARVTVDSGTLFMKDGAFYSCGGGVAAIEIAVAMIEEDYGSSAAVPVARELVTRIRPFGDNNGGSDTLQFQYDPIDRLADLPAWIAAHLNENLSVEALAVKACVCPRHFGRIFKGRFKTTPAAYVERARLDEARRRLRFTRNSVEFIARAVGFTQVNTFRRAFERHYKISPRSYRKESQSHRNKHSSSSLAAA
jgi:transcriptional regulator GlxA family with amidase domain